MKLLIPELKKLLSIKLILWMMAILITANGLLAYWHSVSAEKENGFSGKEISHVVELYVADPEAVENYVAELKEYRKAQNKLKREYKALGIEFVETRTALYCDGLYSEDLKLVELAKAHISQNKRFPDEVKKYISNTEVNRKEYLYYGYDESTVVYRYQELAGERYTEVLNTVTLDSTYTGGWQNFFTYTMGGVFCAVAAILIGSVVFIRERETGMFMILRPSKNGRFTTAVAKVIAALIASAAVSLILTAESLLIFALRDGLTGAFDPLQSVSAFRASTFCVSVIEYTGIFTLFKLAGAMALCAVAMLASVIVSKYIVVFAISAVFFGLNFVAYLTGSDLVQTPLRYLNLFIPFEGVRPAARYSAIVFFGEVSECLYLVIPTALTFAVIAAVLTIPLYCRSTLGNKRIKGIGSVTATFTDIFAKIKKLLSDLTAKIPIRYPSSGRGVELYKILHGGLLALLLVAAVILTSYSIEKESASFFAMTYEEQVCQYYRSGFDGEWTEEKHQAITDKYNESLKATADYNQALEDYKADKIDTSELEHYRKENSRIGRHSEGLKLLKEQSDVLKTMYDETGLRGIFLEEKGWEAIIARGANLFTFSAIILICVGVYAREYAGRPVADIIRASKKGRGFVWRSKTLTVLFISIALAAVCEFVDIRYVANTFPLDFADAPACSVAAFKFVPYEISLGEYLAFCSSLRIISCAALALFVTALSALMKKQLAIIGTAAAITLLPAVAEYIGVDAAEKLNFLSLYGAGRLVNASFAKPEFLGGIGIAIFAASAVLMSVIILTTVSALKWCGKKSH